MGGKEVAFDAVGEELQGFGSCALLLPREASGNPLGKPRALDRIDVDDDSLALERPEPRGCLAGLVQARQRYDGERVGWELSAKRFDRPGAVGSGLAGRQAQLDQLPVAEERAVRTARSELAPVEAALRREDHALQKPACACADRVGGLERKKRLIAVDHVQRPQLAQKRCIQLLEPESGHAYSMGTDAGFAATRRRMICCTMSLCMSR